MFDSPQGILATLMAVVPGYVLLRAQAKLVAEAREASDPSLILRCFAWSVPFMALIIGLRPSDWQNPSPASLWYMMVLLGVIGVLLPMLVGLTLGVSLRFNVSFRFLSWALRWWKISPLHPSKDAWTAALQNSNVRWLTVTLTTGETLVGLYGESSHAGSSDGDTGLYLQEVLDPITWERVPSNATTGVYIPTSAILSVRLHPVAKHADVPARSQGAHQVSDKSTKPPQLPSQPNQEKTFTPNPSATPPPPPRPQPAQNPTPAPPKK